MLAITRTLEHEIVDRELLGSPASGHDIGDDGEHGGRKISGIHNEQAYRRLSFRLTGEPPGTIVRMAGILVRTVSTVVLLAASVALTGCTPTGTTTPEVTPSVTAPPSSTPSPSVTPTPTNTTLPTDKGEPIDLSCDDLISAQTMYEYNANISLTDDFSPKAGTDAATITGDYQGIACRWVNDSSGETIDVAVAHLRADTLETLKNDLVQSSNSVPTYGVEGYFEVQGNVGHADAFSDPYWVSIDSDYFLEPGDATDLFESVIAALG